MDIQDALDNYRVFLDNETPFAEKTKKKYHNIARLFLYYILEKYKKIEFTKKDLNTFITLKTKGGKRGGNVKHGLKNFLISIGQNNLANNLKKIKSKPRKKKFPYFEPRVMNKIINRLKKPYNKIAWLQAHTGARYREAATVKIQDISIPDEGNIIYITVSDYTKGSKKRTIFLRKEHLPLLNQMINNRKFGFMILDEKCNKYGAEDMNRHLDNLLTYYNNNLRDIGEELDIQGLSSHYVRHHFADTYVLKKGKIEALQKILGHAKLETTQSYLSVADYLATKEISEMPDAM